ncbi:MAG: hypothetical protein WDO16_20795 [Bacteroidota bacterium]
MMKQAGARDNENTPVKKEITEEKNTGMTRIGVYEPKGNEPLEFSLLQQHLVNILTEGNIEAVAVTSKEEAEKYNCDLLLTTDFVKFKQGSKLGGILKAIKNTDPSATSSYTIEADLTLSNLSDGITRLQQKVNGKYEGKPDEAAKKALDKGCSQVTRGLK